jgi:hypothetical protein
LTTLASVKLSTDVHPAHAWATAIRRKRPVAAGSSGVRARALDKLEDTYGEGPCLTALRFKTIVHVPDLGDEPRWAEYMQAAAARGIGSIPAVPVDFAGDAAAVIGSNSGETNIPTHFTE